MPGPPHKPHPILLLLRLVLLGALLAAAGIDWYIVFLLARDETDFGQVRKYAGIAGGFTFTLIILLIVAVIILFFTGGSALLFRKGLVSAQGFFSFMIFLFIIGVAGINFAIMPKAKALSDLPVEQANASPEKSTLIKLAIAGASFGTGIIALFLFYYAARGYLATKRSKKVGVTPPGVLAGGPSGSGTVTVAAPIPPANAAAAANAADIRRQQELAKTTLTPKT